MGDLNVSNEERGMTHFHQDQEASSEVTVRLSDLHLAQAIARAVCRIPGVLEMSPGRFALEATYGPGMHVSGVVLRHPTPDALIVEVRVILMESALAASSPFVSVTGTGEKVVLLQMASRIRTAIARTLHRLGVDILTRIDVAFDDVR
jgi:hypothetical protein